MIKYKVNVLNELKARNYTTYRLRKEKLFGESTIQKFRNGIVPSINEINKICKITGLQPGDILEYENESEEESACFTDADFTEKVLKSILYGNFIITIKHDIKISHPEYPYTISYCIYDISVLDKDGRDTGIECSLYIYLNENNDHDVLDMTSFYSGYTLNYGDFKTRSRFISNIHHALDMEKAEDYHSISIIKSNNSIINLDEKEYDIHDERDKYKYEHGTILDAMVTDEYYDHEHCRWTV